MLKVKNITSFFIFLLCSHVLIAQVDSPPEITAIGRQPFCYGSPINIVTDFTISDIDDTGIPVFFVQISEGYQIGFDFLEIVGNFPTIVSSWDANAAKLTLTPSGILSEIPLLDLENAIKNIVFTTSATNVVSEKSFSLTTENANYLPLTDHFYEFVPDDGITWSAAKVAAEARTYFGREGYLATLTTQEEADFAGKQATGTGWIGGSDEETEGVWKWVTGPEAGTIFWNGQVGGTTPTFANWNENEPNDFGAGGEDYAHITDPSIGIRGAWNDLSNTGGTDLYLPRGYIVEYGKPGDPALNIVASTSIYIPQITSITEAVVCESEIATISAIPSEGDILWHDNPNRGTTPALATGNSYTVSVTETTTFYATVTLNGCITGERIPVTVTVNQIPTIISTTDDEICDGVAELFAVPSAGEVFWYDSLTSTTALATGEYFRTPPISESTTYYVEAEIAGSSCNSLIRTAVNAIVNPIIPSFEIERRQYALCEDIGEVELRTINPQDNYTYFWTKDGNSFSGNSATITVREVGVYAVKAISTAGCESREQTIEVVTSEIATITNDDVIELGTVISKGVGRSNEDQITVADLTGVAVQDLKIAEAIFHGATKS